MTVWEQWCEELKKCGKDLANKKLLICNCGLYDMECTNKGNGKKCPLFNTRFCGHNYIESDKYLESEVKPDETER